MLGKQLCAGSERGTVVLKWKAVRSGAWSMEGVGGVVARREARERNSGSGALRALVTPSPGGSDDH